MAESKSSPHSVTKTKIDKEGEVSGELSQHVNGHPSSNFQSFVSDQTTLAFSLSIF
jgi:hypothetical protein